MKNAFKSKKKNSTVMTVIIIVGIVLAGFFVMLTVTGGGDNKEGEKQEALSPQPSQTQAAEEAVEVSTTTAANIGDDQPVSRGLVAKMLALTFYDQSYIDGLERNMPFTDTTTEDWYDRYINAVYQGGYMSGYGDKFMPQESITLEQAQILLDKLDPNNEIKVELTEQTKDTPISYALWTTLYTNLLDNMSKDSTIKEAFGIDTRSFIVLATPENNSQLKEWNMITDKGPLTYVGLNMEPYIDKEITVLQKGSDVMAVLSVDSLTPTLKNAYITTNDKNSVTVFSGGAERTYTYDNNIEGAQGKICDLTINGEQATDIVIYEEKINDIVMKTTMETIETKSKGELTIGQDFKVYSTADGGVKWKKLSDIIVGYDITDFVMKDGQVCAAIINEKPIIGDIRVALNTTGFGGLIHSNPSFTCDQDYTLTAADVVTNYKAGEVLTITDEVFGDAKRILIQPETEAGRVTVLSVTRDGLGNGNPSYRGAMEVSKTDGGYNLVNIVDFEEYLYAVVPSEMPSSYGVEASKAQAVTARSYAHNQFFANRFHASGANVDDSVSCQVYNNIPENETSIAAVNETEGKCLTYNDKVIAANFFSTSSGMTANSGDVWIDGASHQFPTATKPYLQAEKQYTGADYGDLSIEANAAKFFKATDVEGHDSGSPWFRWKVEMTADEVEASINANLKDRYYAHPSLIKTLQPDGVYRSQPIETIGDLKNLEVTERGQGGNIMEMKITGTEATILVSTEYNIRTLIKPKQYIEGGRSINLVDGEGSEHANYSIMPSAFYTMERMTDHDGNIVSVRFFGGGNGHGVGMSQNGAQGMIEQGHTYDEVLAHYYQGTEVETVE